MTIQYALNRREVIDVLELRDATEFGVLADALERHLEFLDSIIDRVAATEGSGYVERAVDAKAEAAAALLVRLAKLDTGIDMESSSHAEGAGSLHE